MSTSEFANFLVAQLQEHANPLKASQMQAYMKTQQPFYGVAAPERKKLFRLAKKQFSIQSQQEYEDTILKLWHSSYRESQYQALEVAEAYKKFRTLQSLPLYERLLLSAENWDTVDWIAITLVGILIVEHLKVGDKSLESWLLKWREHDNFWLRRSALIAHIKHKQHTNIVLLSETILMLSHETEFFIRKAIGWTLREYSKTDAFWVENFVQQHENQLSGLSKREALKAINRNKEKQK
jgi:3-methyladenine DNA glycosylase AlkD